MSTPREHRDLNLNVDEMYIILQLWCDVCLGSRRISRRALKEQNITTPPSERQSVLQYLPSRCRDGNIIPDSFQNITARRIEIHNTIASTDPRTIATSWRRTHKRGKCLTRIWCFAAIATGEMPLTSRPAVACYEPRLSTHNDWKRRQCKMMIRSLRLCTSLGVSRLCRNDSTRVLK
jgi:hypothetical protein